ncbi:DnaJ domain-containing protein [Lacrimispora brassicae]
MADYYKILGVLSQASDKEIKAAYRKLAKQYHPDAVKDNCKLAEKMYEIQSAYDVLGDKEKRKKYDESLRKEKNRDKHRQLNVDKGTKNPNTALFEHFFGFQVEEGMDMQQSQQINTKRANAPINVEELFATYFGQKK